MQTRTDSQFLYWFMAKHWKSSYQSMISPPIQYWEYVKYETHHKLLWWLAPKLWEWMFDGVMQHLVGGIYYPAGSTKQSAKSQTWIPAYGYAQGTIFRGSGCLVNSCIVIDGLMCIIGATPTLLLVKIAGVFCRVQVNLIVVPLSTNAFSTVALHLVTNIMH